MTGLAVDLANSYPSLQKFQGQGELSLPLTYSYLQLQHNPMHVFAQVSPTQSSDSYSHVSIDGVAALTSTAVEFGKAKKKHNLSEAGQDAELTLKCCCYHSAMKK